MFECLNIQKQVSVKDIRTLFLVCLLINFYFKLITLRIVKSDI